MKLKVSVTATTKWLNGISKIVAPTSPGLLKNKKLVHAPACRPKQFCLDLFVFSNWLGFEPIYSKCPST
ncbi:MAG: hypothetical protein JXC36_04280 [Candidatus Atribacteria bacterium]|nr:hypothetical protein [Candidatus Atribacteria bacterium]